MAEVIIDHPGRRPGHRFEHPALVGGSLEHIQQHLALERNGGHGFGAHYQWGGPCQAAQVGQALSQQPAAFGQRHALIQEGAQHIQQQGGIGRVRRFFEQRLELVAGECPREDDPPQGFLQAGGAAAHSLRHPGTR